MAEPPVLRTVFMGSPALAVPSLRALAEAPDFDLHGVVTVGDARRSRRGAEVPTPVGEAALELDIPLIRWERGQRREVEAQITAMRPDLIVVIAFARILRPSLLQVPRLGCVNLHASILPWGRGASPIQHALLEGLDETGWTVMLMDEGLDTGPLLVTRTLSIEEDWNAGDLGLAMSEMGPGVLISALRNWRDGVIEPRVQPEEGVTFTRKIPREAGVLDWSLPALDLHRLVRALNPEPGAWCRRRSARLGILRTRPAEGSGEAGTVLEAPKGALRIACGKGALDLLELKPEGKGRMPAADYLRGRPFSPGEGLDRG